MYSHSFVLLERMVINLIEDRATNLLIGYFDRVKRKFRALPEPLSQLLDTAGEAHPLSVTLITLQSDISDAGFERLLRVAPLSGPNPSARLRLSGTGNGLRSCRRSRRRRLLNY